MPQKLPFLYRFLSKLLCELLPAAIASAVGGMLFNHYAYAPVVTPAAAIDTASDENIVKTKLHELNATAERISWVRWVAEWLSDEVPTRPLTQLPERQILKVWM